MNEINVSLAILISFSPLVGALMAGLFENRIGAVGAQFVTISGVSVAFVSAVILLFNFTVEALPALNHTLYVWMASDQFTFEVGFWLDRLSVLMSVVVTSVSLLVHIYSMAYMKDDPGIGRFFAYVSFFTFAMLILVFGNNLLQVFFGWEGVGVASYLLIGFWFNKDSAANGAFKAFIVNRVGDFGFLLGMGVIFAAVGSLSFVDIFAGVNALKASSWLGYSLFDWACFLLFIGAMGKSAQVPLHIWLPESMEGPTPISALIHAATMVTAGVYLVIRMSPVFELSETVRAIILILGATGGLFLGLVGIVQNDIKRVVAYSTLSQLGYMMAAAGASAYGLALFHLVTHAFFKALLFLGAGSVILATHHEQDMQKFGGLWREMPITAATFLIGSVSLMALPFTSGFYSKDAIIAAVGHSSIAGGSYAYVCLVLGVAVTSIYSVRAFYLTFMGTKRYPHPVKENGFLVTIPLMLLAIPSLFLGERMASLIGDTTAFGQAIFYSQSSLKSLSHVFGELTQPVSMAIDSVYHLPLWIMIVSSVATILVLRQGLQTVLSQKLRALTHVLVHKLYFDCVVECVIVPTVLWLSRTFRYQGDERFVDRAIVMQVGGIFPRISGYVRTWVSGYLYHYASVMLVGLFVFIYYVVTV